MVLTRLTAWAPIFQRTGLVAATIAIWLLALVIWQGTALGNNWGSDLPNPGCDDDPSSQCVAKNGLVDYWFINFGTANFESRAASIWEAEYNNHPENDGSVTVFKAVSQSYADAKFYDNYVGSSSDHAWTWCPTSATKVKVGTDKKYCEPQKVTFNTKYDHKFDDVNEAKAYACHEMGHVFGLRHRGSFCMKNPLGTTKDLGNHDMHCLRKYCDGAATITANPAPWQCQ